MDVVLHFHLLVVSCHNVLLLLAPVELLPFILSYFLDSVDFLIESIVSSFLDLVGVVDILRPFVLGMVVNFEWPMRPQETGVEVGLVLVRDVLSLKSKPDQLFGT